MSTPIAADPKITVWLPAAAFEQFHQWLIRQQRFIGNGYTVEDHHGNPRPALFYGDFLIAEIGE